MSGDDNSKWQRIGVIIVGLLVGAALAYGYYLRIRAREVQVKAQAKQLQNAIQTYVIEYGFSPKGDSAAVMAALRGGNERHIVFFEAPPRLFNARGEIVDAWGEPFRFDLDNGGPPHVWSTGRNRRDENGADGSDDIRGWK
jgi:hypothetical protein